MSGATDVIATLVFGRDTYEIAWPWDPDHEPGMRRHPWLGVVRQHNDDIIELFPDDERDGYTRAVEVVVDALHEIGPLLEVQA